MRKIFTLFVAALCCAGLANATEGALPGIFAINAQGDQVQFSQGNLLCRPYSKIWRFAEHQWDFVGNDTLGSVYEGDTPCTNDYHLANYDRWIDLFAWGTGDNPMLFSNDLSVYNTFTDWGTNAITNGGNTPNIWRSLSIDEWKYILKERPNAKNLQGVCAIQYQTPDGTIREIAGLVLLPDNWEGNFLFQTYVLGSWENLNIDQKGVVFLPFAGRSCRTAQGTCSSGIGKLPYYWSSTEKNAEEAFDFHYYSSNESFSFYGNLKRYGCSVRLVRPYEKPEPVSEPKALTGRFSVSADKQVIFSQGNLRYKASSNEWSFANSQYSMIGQKNGNISANYQGWIDLFGWGTGNNPTESSTQSSAYGSYADWTTNTIANGNNEAWYMLTADEWNYLLKTRPNAASLQGQAVVNDIKGYILLPDNWTIPLILTFTPTPNDYTTNVYTLGDWELMEAAGAVFLPAAGYRYGIDINGLNAGNGYYWTSTPSSQYDDMAQALMISKSPKAQVNVAMPCNGYAVRPVREVKANEGIEQPTSDSSLKGRANKVVRDGQLLIERNGKTYNAQGAEVK